MSNAGSDGTHEARHPGAVAQLHAVQLPREVRRRMPLPRQQELVRFVKLSLSSNELAWRSAGHIYGAQMPKTSADLIKGVCNRRWMVSRWMIVQCKNPTTDPNLPGTFVLQCCRCEKFCACGPACAIRFQGCDCKATSTRCATKRCPCFAAGVLLCLLASALAVRLASLAVWHVQHYVSAH